jgi:hypothetical protein
MGTRLKTRYKPKAENEKKLKLFLKKLDKENNNNE